MDVFDFNGVTGVLLGDGWHHPDPGTMRRRTATRWLDGEPSAMVEWTEKGASVFLPVDRVQAIRSSSPAAEPPRQLPVHPLAEFGGRPTFDSDAAAHSNDPFAGRPAYI